MQARGDARENGTTLRACLIADGNNVIKALVAFQKIQYGLRPVLRNIETAFTHRLHHDGIEFAGFESGALRVKVMGAMLIQKRFRHLAARTVVNADEQDLLFHTRTVAKARRQSNVCARIFAGGVTHAPVATAPRSWQIDALRDVNLSCARHGATAHIEADEIALGITAIDSSIREHRRCPTFAA